MKIPVLCSSPKGCVGQLAESLNNILQEASALAHPIFIGDALCLRAFFRASQIASYRVFCRMINLPPELPEAILSPPRVDAENAINFYLQANQLEGELRAKITLAEILMLGNKKSEAQDIAREVLPKAQIMEYLSIISRAQDCIADKVLLSQLEKIFVNSTSSDTDIKRAEDSNEYIKRGLLDAIKALNLPDDRLQILESEFFSFREASRARLNWCRHIELLQDVVMRGLHFLQNRS